MVFCIYHFKASKLNKRDIDEILQSVIEPVRYKPGCISSRIWNNNGETESLLLLEEWESAKYLQNHFASTSFRRVLAALELCNEKPDVRFIDCDQVKDLEWLVKACYESIV